MITLKDIKALVLDTIELGILSHKTWDLTSSTTLYFSCSIINGRVYYYLAVIKTGEFLVEFHDCSLEFILNFDCSPYYVFSDIELLDLYSNHYSLSKTELSKSLGISRPTLNKYLSGSVPLPLIYKKFIALDFGIPSQYLDFDFLSTDNYCPLTKQQINTLPF